MDISSKVAVVTGGASGLGRAIIEKLVANGAKAAIFDLNEEAGNNLAAELGDSVIYQSVNVADEISVQRGIDNTMSAFGAIHICVTVPVLEPRPKLLVKKGHFLWTALIQ